MKKSLLKVLFKFIIPVIILLILYNYKFIFGFSGLILYLGFLIISGRASLYGSIGNFKYARGDVAGSLEWFGKAYRASGVTARTQISYGYLLLKTAHVDEAEKVLTKLLTGKPESEDEKSIKSNLALLLWKKGDIDSATAMLEDLIKDYKTSAIYGSLGYFYILKGDLEKALEFNLEARDYNSTNTVILDNLGQTYYLLDQLDKSLETFEKVMSLKPTFHEAYYNYGLLLMKLGQYDKSLEMLQKAQQFKISYLSTVTKEDIEKSIEKLENLMQPGNEPAENMDS